MSIKKLKRKLIYARQLVRPKKVLNLLIKEFESRSGRAHVSYIPNKLTIDIGNMCNLRCPLCPTGRRDEGASKGIMKFEQYTKIIDEIGAYLTKLELHNWGEPLINKDLVRMIEYAKERGIPVSISTNLMLLTEETAEGLIRSGIDKILISCDGASQETYAKYRVGGDFDTVIANIRLLVGAKKKFNNTYTNIRMLFHVFRHNEHEVDKIQKIAADLGVDLLIDPMRMDMGKEIFEKTEDAMARDGEWIPEKSEFSYYNIGEKKKKKAIGCSQLWDNAVINWDGTVLPCCHIYSERYGFGNVFEETFRTIWNNKAYTMSRMEVTGKIKKCPTICHTCKKNGYPVF